MAGSTSRSAVWSALDRRWDVVVVGGGITGAGILAEAARAGLSALLVEARDFAWGTSSRSSKLVHGGLRYMRQAQFGLTLQSVRERERLLGAKPHLVQELPFLLPTWRGDRIPPWAVALGLTIYDLLGLQWRHKRFSRDEMSGLCPELRTDGLRGAFGFVDAQTDDARLVLRVLAEAQHLGATAINYARAERPLRTREGRVRGVLLRDEADETGREVEVEAKVVIAATGAWSDDLRGQLGRKPELRRLRGSHLFLPADRLPLRQAVSLVHPRDRRAVFAYGWEGVTIVGTTDVDHTPDLAEEPRISQAEADYLLQAVRHAFPGQELGERDVQATIAGVRAVVDTGKADPSKESREHVLHDDGGLLTITGGKLTTFRAMGREALGAAKRWLPGLRLSSEAPTPPQVRLDEVAARAEPEVAIRLLSRYGRHALERLDDARQGDLERLGEGPTLVGELRWAARDEAVVHLDDLLLRRVRLGQVEPEGGLPLLGRIRPLVQPELGWDDARWGREAADYADLWQRCYGPP